jgi:hypothetical protein
MARQFGCQETELVVVEERLRRAGDPLRDSDRGIPCFVPREP